MILKQYIRNKKTNNPIGVMLAELREGEVHIGYSLCHRNDNYDKQKGQAIAYSRLKSEKDINIPYSIIEEFGPFIQRAYKYFRVQKDS